MDVKEESILGDAIGDHWYYRAKSDAIVRALADLDPQTAIDVGSGSGFFARALIERTGLDQIDCVDTAYESDRDEPIDGGLLRFRTDLGDTTDDVDLVVLMDVLEHVDDDVSLLLETTERLRAGGRALITVPAFQFLWSSHYDFLGHRRRYTLATARTLAQDAGLVIERAHYVYGTVFPAAVAQRFIDRGEGSKLQVHHPVVNRLLFAACRAEGPLQRYNRVAGLSVLVLARRP